MYRISKK